ncbi:MAG TPA: hypothetical protein VFQ39_00530 [Longimicrobium sp.]|nr:hypothetical protein [Longimicrobium sp.]
METDLPEVALQESEPEKPGASRREFLGKAAGMAVVAGASTLLTACESVAGTSEPDARSQPAAPEGINRSLGGGRDFGATLHSMVAGTIGSNTDVKVPALEKGTATTYIQRVVTDTDRTGTGLATVLKSKHTSPSGVTVQVIVQDSRGRVWPARTVSKNSDLTYAMKDALATNPNVYGVLRTSLTAGSAVVAISKSHIIQFQDSVASDYYGNHLDIHSRGLCDIFNTQVSGIKIASTTRDPSRC